jgi:hypothetical protein
VQAAGVVLLDHEALPAGLHGVFGRQRLRCALRVALTPVVLEPIGHTVILCPQRPRNTPA